MYRLVVLTVVIMCCNGQYSAPITQTKTFGAPLAAPMAASIPAAPVFATKSYAAPISQVQYAAPIAAPVVRQMPAYGPVEAAVQTRRTIEYRDIALPQDLAAPQEIEVSPNYENVLIHFKTASSPLSVRQSHIPAPVAPVEHTSYQDNAHRLVNEIVKPVIQEVREIIQPYRRITQEIRPVIEEVHTIVHKGQKRAYVQPLPLKLAEPTYGAGAPALVVNAIKGYAAKAAAKA